MNKLIINGDHLRMIEKLTYQKPTENILNDETKSFQLKS